MTHAKIRAAVESRHTGEQKTLLVQSAIADGIAHAFEHVRVLSIDAWYSPEGRWDWNNWYSVGLFPLGHVDDKPRAIFRRLRALGLLSAASAGRVSLDDDGYNLVVRLRASGEPIFAIEYGARSR